MMWAFSFGNYKEWFKQNDTATGQDCILLPGAGGDARCDMAQLREERTQTQQNRITAIFANQFGSTLEQRNMTHMLRKARGLSLMNDNASIKEWRRLNEVIWEYWANDFPAFVKQRHYCRGLSSMVVWSANDIACANHGQTTVDMRRHEDRAPTSARELMKTECEGGVPTLMPVHVQVDLSRFIDV
eukprot:2251949-Pyramimonas_sp.AAC.1